MIEVTTRTATTMNDEKTIADETPNAARATDADSRDATSGELYAPCWSVITFEKCAAKNLSYAEATKKIRQLKRRNVSGLCIVTDEAAERIKINC